MLNDGSCDGIDFDRHRAPIEAFEITLSVAARLTCDSDGHFCHTDAETSASASEAAATIVSTSASVIGVESAISP